MAPPGWYDDPLYGAQGDTWRRSWATCFIDGKEEETLMNACCDEARRIETAGTFEGFACPVHGTRWTRSLVLGETTLKGVQAESYAVAMEKGWGDKVVPVPEMCALLHSEVREALEAFRENQPTTWTDESGKPQGIGSEFADVLIRMGHYSNLLKIDLQYEYSRKTAYNRTRPYRHGGKAI